MQEDFNVFFSDFGQNISFFDQNITDGYGSLTVKALFDDAYIDKNIGEIILESSTPRLTCIESEVSQVKKGDNVTVNNINYNVLSKQPDGTGMILIVLAKKKQ